jgi:hypothetical protein
MSAPGNPDPPEQPRCESNTCHVLELSIAKQPIDSSPQVFVVNLESIERPRLVGTPEIAPAGHDQLRVVPGMVMSGNLRLAVHLKLLGREATDHLEHAESRFRVVRRSSHDQAGVDQATRWLQAPAHRRRPWPLPGSNLQRTPRVDATTAARLS